MSSALLGVYGRVVNPGRKLSFQLVFTAWYSRKHDSKNADCSFKVVKSTRNLNDQPDALDDGSTNWELLAPKGYKYILPGSTGLALQQPIPLPYSYKRSHEFTFEVRECPLVLKKVLGELFEGNINQSSQTMTVITLRHKGKPLADHESIAMKFLQDSQSICTRLMVAGYWADFINPFSGKPHFTSVIGQSLYLGDCRFRCLGFEIKEKKNCTVIKTDQPLQMIKNPMKDDIDDTKDRLFEKKTDDVLQTFMHVDSAKPARFIGNLFTNAPRNLDYFMNLSKSKPH